MLFIFTLLGCFLDKNERSSMPYCEESPTSIELDSEYEDFSWQLWRDTLGENGQVSGSTGISWEDSGADCLIWQFIPDPETANYVASEAVYPEGNVTAIGVECSDYVEISGSLSLQSGDGRINETLPTTLTRSFGQLQGTDAQTSFQLEISDWQGTLDTSIFETSSALDSQSLGLSLSFTEEGFTGEFTLQSEGSDEETAWASNDVIASFDGECGQIEEQNFSAVNTPPSTNL